MTRTFQKFSKPITSLSKSNSKTTRPKYVNHLNEDFIIDNSNDFQKAIISAPAPAVEPIHYECCLCLDLKLAMRMMFISCREKGIMKKVTRRERDAANPICKDCLKNDQLNREECPCCRSHGLYLVKKRYPKKKDTFLERKKKKLVKQEKEKKGAIINYAIHMGMDPKIDKRYLYIAEQAMNAPLPIGWTKSIKKSKIVYNDGLTNKYSHPEEDIYVDKYVRLKYRKR